MIVLKSRSVPEIDKDVKLFGSDVAIVDVHVDSIEGGVS
jgi:hypothetical protein